MPHTQEDKNGARNESFCFRPGSFVFLSSTVRGKFRLTHLVCHDLREVERKAHRVVQKERSVSRDDLRRLAALLGLDLLEVSDAPLLGSDAVRHGPKKHTTHQTKNKYTNHKRCEFHEIRWYQPTNVGGRTTVQPAVVLFFLSTATKLAR